MLDVPGGLFTNIEPDPELIFCKPEAGPGGPCGPAGPSGPGGPCVPCPEPLHMFGHTKAYARRRAVKSPADISYYLILWLIEDLSQQPRSIASPQRFS